MSGRVLVTGASGFIGCALCEALVRSGYRVAGVGRSSNVGFLNGVDYIVRDLKGDDLSEIMTGGGFDALVHLAGLAHGKDGGGARDKAFRDINVGVTAKVAEAAIRARVNRFIFVSSVSVHGIYTSSAPITEDSPLEPHSVYAQSKLDAETALISLFRDKVASGLVIVRPPLVYGVKAPGNLQRLLRLTALRCPLPFASCNNRRSMVSISNLVAFLVMCIDHPQAAGQVFVLSDGTAVSTKQIVSALRHGMKRRSALFPVALPIMKTTLTLAGRRDMYQQLFGDLVVDSRKAERLLGWVPDRNTLKQLEAVGASHVDPHS